VLTLGDVLFDTGRAELNPGATRTLDQLVQFLNDQPDRRIEIDDYTDSVGTDSFNLDLSQRRAGCRALQLKVGLAPMAVLLPRSAGAMPLRVAALLRSTT
jgi:hypothetical protein